MPDRPFGWSLPPGVSYSDIPGNRPEDEELERLFNDFCAKEKEALANFDSLILKAIKISIELERKVQELIEAGNKFYEDKVSSEEDPSDESRD